MNVRTLVAVIGAWSLPAGILAAEEMLVWRGCGVSKTAFMAACAKAYREETGVPIRVSGGGARLGLVATAEGGADLGGSCRALLAEEAGRYPDLRLCVVAWDALVVIVQEGHEVDNLSKDQLREILLGRVRNWQEVGGPDRRLVVVARRGDDSGVGHCVRRLILKDEHARLGTVRLHSSGPVERLVARHRDAVAVTGISSVRQQQGLKALAIDGVAPSVENIASGAYPYYRPLYIAFVRGRNPHADRFVRWLIGPRGQKTIESQQTVTLYQGRQLAKRCEALPKSAFNFDQLMELAD